MILYLYLGYAFLGFLTTYVLPTAVAARRILFFVSGLNILTLAWAFATISAPQIDFFLSRAFVSDPSSRLFLTLVMQIWVGFTGYVANRLTLNHLAAHNFHLFVRYSLLFLFFCLVAIFSNHLILTWAALEATTLTVIPLIYHQRGLASYRAAWKYLIFSTVGLALTFFGLLCLYQAGQVQNEAIAVPFYLDELRNLTLTPNIWTDLAIFFSILGLATKLGLAPMYAWLPETYDHAPPSVTVLLAAVQFNCAVLMLFRMIAVLRNVDSTLLNGLLIAVGLLSLAVAAVNIIVTNNLKRLIAYASINHAGVIALGLGVGKVGNYGVVLYVLSNALVKAMLFFSAGNIKARFGTKTMTELQGLIKDMPYSGLFFMIGIFALLGFAPFGSFIGEVMIMSSMIEAGRWLVFTALCILIIITFVATGRSVFPMLWGQPKLEPHERGESIYTLIPNLFYLSMLLSMGIYIPAIGNEVILAVAKQLGGP